MPQQEPLYMKMDFILKSAPRILRMLEQLAGKMSRGREASADQW